MNDPLLESGLKQKQDKSKNNSNNRMRGGGPRMVCSPYFVTGVFILLVIVTMRYWSLSSQNTALTDRLERLQIKLKSTSYDLEDLHSKLAKQEDEVKACLDKMEKDEAALKDTWAEKVVDVERERDACRGDLDQAKRGLEECSEAKAEAEARLEAAQRDKEETLGLRNSDVEEKEERIREKDEEIRGLKEKLEQSLGEINSLKNAEAEKIKIQAGKLTLDGKSFLKGFSFWDLGYTYRNLDLYSVRIKTDTIVKFCNDDEKLWKAAVLDRALLCTGWFTKYARLKKGSRVVH